MTLTAMATDYTDTLTVTVNGVSSQQTALISVVKQGDGNYMLTLNNFILNSGDSKIGIGNIVLKDVGSQSVSNGALLQTKQDITITEGSDASISTWLGPTLGNIPVDMVSMMNESSLRTVINIDMSATLGQKINVQFGSGYQLPNSGFEEYHSAGDNIVEPNAWHSFATATGKLASATSNSVFKSSEVRKSATGTSSAMIRSTKIFGIIANGTMTTGRLNAGSAFATNAANHSSLDMSVTDKDGNGDPFYTVMKGKPDSLDVYVKFKQGTPNKDYPNATVSAAITDGTYYQEPTDKTYTNILATAKNATIETNDFAWQKLSIPFDYASYSKNNASGKAILVTISTNATPGKGSLDTLYVDDISMVYNAKLASLKFKGADVSGFSKDVYSYDLSSQSSVSADDITAEADGEGAYVTKTVTTTEGKTTAVVSVYSNDLTSVGKYTLNITVPSGITDITDAAGETVKKIYNAAGQQVSVLSKGINIIRYSNGKTVKVLKK